MTATTAMKGSDLFAAGDLAAAVATLTEQVRLDPTDQESRGLLAELLCLSGELERADKQLEVLSNQDPEAAPALAMFRQVIRAELARTEFYKEGRLPEFIGAPAPPLKKHLEASVLLREGCNEEAAQRLAEAEEARALPAGSCNGIPFDDFRDLDDLTASFLEVLTTTGKYYWIPVESVDAIEFRRPDRPRDLLWRRALLNVKEGPDGEVFIPAIYADPMGFGTDQSRLGRTTDWVGGEQSPITGVGQRAFLVGETAIPIMELERVTFSGTA